MTKKRFSNIYILGDSLSDEGSLTNAMSDMLNNLSKKQKIIFNSVFFKRIKNIDDYSYKFMLDSESHYKGMSFSNGPTVIRLLCEWNNYSLNPAYCETNFNLLNTETKIGEKIGNNYSMAGAVANHFKPELFSNVNNFMQFVNQPFYIMVKKIFANLNEKTTITHQADWLIKQHNDLDKSLVFIAIGGNDILNLDLMFTKKINDNNYEKGLKYINESNLCVKKAIINLINNGAKNIVILNAVDVTLLPRISERSNDYKKNYTKLINIYNNNLKKDIDEINAIKKVCFLFDLNNLFKKIYQEAKDNNMILDIGEYKRSAFKFEIDEENKIINIISKSKKTDMHENKEKSEYLFWDGIHPNKWGHLKTAEEILKFLNSIKFN